MPGPAEPGVPERVASVVPGEELQLAVVDDRAVVEANAIARGARGNPATTVHRLEVPGGAVPPRVPHRSGVVVDVEVVHLPVVDDGRAVTADGIECAAVGRRCAVVVLEVPGAAVPPPVPQVAAFVEVEDVALLLARGRPAGVWAHVPLGAAA